MKSLPNKQIVFLMLLIHFIGLRGFASEFVYVPEKFKSPQSNLVVVFHGCLQTPESMAMGTHWNTLADRHGFAVFYPQSSRQQNPIGCWNWFLPENQGPGSGLLKTLHRDIFNLKGKLKLPRQSKVFLVGLSSGAAMVSGLLACFPRDFAAGAVHSGPSYGLAQSVAEADKVLKSDPMSSGSQEPDPKLPCSPRNSQADLISIQGSADEVVHPQHSERLMRDFFAEPKVSQERSLEENELKYVVRDFVPQKGRRARAIMIENLPHAWAGYLKLSPYSALIGPGKKFNQELPFFTERGPSSTELIWNFFSGHEVIKN